MTFTCMAVRATLLAGFSITELWVSKDQGETWELRAELPEDMGRAGMQVVEIDGTIYFMGGDHDNPVFVANWPGRRNDVWKSDDLGQDLGVARQCALGAAHRAPMRRSTTKKLFA